MGGEMVFFSFVLYSKYCREEANFMSWIYLKWMKIYFWRLEFGLAAELLSVFFGDIDCWSIVGGSTFSWNSLTTFPATKEHKHIGNLSTITPIYLL